MGSYTEVYVNVDFKKGLSDEVIKVCKGICAGIDEYLEGYPERWSCLGSNMSYYTPSTSVSNFTFDDISGQFSLLLKGDIKNYHQEIQMFFEFIKPHVDGNFMGYYRYEEAKEPTLVFTDRRVIYEDL